MTDARIEALESALPKLAEGDRRFANDLIHGQWGYEKRGKLSDKQWAWVEKLTARADEPAPEPTKVGNMKKLFAMFEGAKAKYPKLHLEINGYPVKLALTGAKSKYPNHLAVTDEEPYPDNKFYGWVSPDGDWIKGYKEYEELNAIYRLLRNLSWDAEKVVSAYGHKTGRCCFCHHKLSDDKSGKSVEMGYGPHCAKKWGLPWGKKA